MSRCAGKKLHKILFSSSDKENAVVLGKFKEECSQHAQLRHPSIVQLVGLYTPPDELPMLVMECMHSSLSSTLDKHKDVPIVLKRQILYDVILGLRFLHERSDPIIHRDLTANNVLLTEDFRAKISDLGVAKIVPRNEVQKKMTTAPGTVLYMPPEALVANPVYDTKLDMFSYGILILHVVTQTWPDPHMPTSSRNYTTGNLEAHSEAKRRSNYFRSMASHPLLADLANQCLENEPTLRIPAKEVAELLEPLVAAVRQSEGSFPILDLTLAKEDAERRTEDLHGLSQNMESQLHMILQDLDGKFSLDGPELDSMKQQMRVVVRNTRHVINGACGSTYDFSQQRFVVAYRSRSVSGTTQTHAPLHVSSACGSTPHPVSVTISTPLNITFSGTFVKTVIDDLVKPFGLAVNGDMLCVVDSGGWYGVHLCSISGEGPETKSIIESSSRYDGKVTPLDKCWYPNGVAIDTDKNIILVDTWSHRVVKFSPDGTYLASTGRLNESGCGEGEFNKPVGVCVSSIGDVYVCDRSNHRIKILNSDLLSRRSFGSQGSGACEFCNPWDVAFDSKGNVYVVDCGNYCVKVYTREFETYLRQIGCKGTGNGDFLAPSSICIDSNDYVYVTDMQSCCVQVFSPAGAFVMKFGGPKHEMPEFCFKTPMGIALNSMGKLFVSDSGNKRVLMFE